MNRKQVNRAIEMAFAAGVLCGAVGYQIALWWL